MQRQTRFSHWASRHPLCRCGAPFVRPAVSAASTQPGDELVTTAFQTKTSFPPTNLAFLHYFSPLPPIVEKSTYMYKLCLFCVLVVELLHMDCLLFARLIRSPLSPTPELLFIRTISHLVFPRWPIFPSPFDLFSFPRSQHFLCAAPCCIVRLSVIKFIVRVYGFQTFISLK